MATNITDLKKARELVNYATHLLADTRMNLDETLQNLDWAELDIIKYTKAIAEDMGLIDGSCTYDEYIDLCKNILDKSPIALEDITIEMFVDLMFWQALFNIIELKGIEVDSDKLAYIRTWFPTLESKFFRINWNMELFVKL